MTHEASQLKESLLAKSRSSRRSRWDEDDDLACSALDVNEGTLPNELESHYLLLKIAGSKSQTHSTCFAASENNCAPLALSAVPVGRSAMVEVDRMALHSATSDSGSAAFQSRPMYATHGARCAPIPGLQSSSKRMARSHALVAHGTTVNLPATPLICSLRATEANKNLSTTMKTVASTLEQQYTSLLKDAATKTGEAAALYYLHTKALAFNDLLDRAEAHDRGQDVTQYNTIFSCYNDWRQSLDNIVLDEAFSTNQLAIEQPDAFTDGTHSSVVQATKLVLLQEGDSWFTKELLKKLDHYRACEQCVREDLANLLLGLNPQNLKIPESQRGMLLLVLSELYTI
ncbi:hypothetical protein GL50803_0013945 [Giardia duodenalis]|uniref:Uncharacterized protein n=1 Tax=Giardia intestinalis (strain ATCC 50803 / WB clone C6) TaxID=184922 RepID=A8BIJ7_GIAIC|nr:hypothetical protein GL50803_0013945 [Giardia intestinalis]KAE8305627.1 hypothetical protein GL50803_0013945 [Giardia intestinalis]|eukprot:XP_001706852.1 Hypothetical protein GL50803_13945 [Giardia lamblia ATCC 50803]